jgi:GntR family transcriptional repressor for pyruvate dehydrogenase complex
MDESTTHAPGEIFQSLERDATLAARVTETIKSYIVTGHFQAGDRLPAERELARQFGVSRTVVREAVRSLTAQGLLEVRAGSGSLVRNPSAQAVAESMSLYLRMGTHQIDYPKLLEVRRILEVEIAGLAALRRSDEDIALLDAILQETMVVGGDREGWTQNDMAFHAMLARATKNELFVLLLDSIADALVTMRRMGFSVPGAAARTLRFHGAILAEVRAGDPERARQAMREHLDEAQDTIGKAMALQALDIAANM